MPIQIAKVLCSISNYQEFLSAYLVIFTKPACQRDVATTLLAVCHLLALRHVISPNSQSGYVEINTQNLKIY